MPDSSESDCFRRQKLEFTKLEVARSQLESAVWLFFKERDPVSIHTLTAAAYTVLQDLNRGEGGTPMLVKDLIKALVPPEEREAVHRKLNEAENFFKHADRDPDGKVAFIPLQTIAMLFDAGIKYHEMTGAMPDGMNMFVWWLAATTPDLFTWPEPVADAAQQYAANLRGVSRREFHALLRPFASEFPDAFGPVTHQQACELAQHVKEATKQQQGRED